MQGQLLTSSREVESRAGFPERWVPAFRVVVVALILLHIVLFTVSIPADFQQRLDDIDTAETNIVEQIQSAGLTREIFAGYLTGITVLGGVVFATLGLLIFFRQSHAFMPLFVALVMVTEGTQIGGLFYSLELLHSWGRWVAEVMDVLTSTLLVTFFFLFPNGRFVPGWTRWVSLTVFILGIAGVVVQAMNPTTDYTSVIVLYLIPVFGLMVYAQVHRYRRMPLPADRQRVKWVIVGMVAALMFFMIAALATILDPDRGPVAIMFWFTLANVGFVLIPLAITIAILRYQLFDIDRLINRTVVYAILSAILGGTYFGSVILLQWPLGSIAGSSGLAVALSTLVSVAMFKPMRERVQRTVDRRFYRTRYDAEELLARFSRSVRDEVDLDHLQRLLSITIAHSVRPEQVSIWLDSTAGSERNREQPGDASA